MTAEHGFWHKAGEMLLEIVIIVFAVSLSIWLHSVGEHRHEQKQVKTFLLGLKRDIQSDQAQVKQIVAFHRASDQRYAYLAAGDPKESPDGEKFDEAYRHLPMNNFLVPRLGRYEGFKSSGKLTNIENEALLEKIVNLYQYDLPKADLSSDGWKGHQKKLLAYAEQQTEEDDGLAARYKMATSAAGKRHLRQMVTYPQLYDRYQSIVDGGNAIIKDIDQAYPDQAQPL
ncbi:hypothetical protein CR105_21580 [Massilia eurypsychrophila]|uniref:Uncharacterized protein n=1 Tax=Massilia eurypsychrophila TaxID=1485217 RepID=A0A2G8TA78_9BURK|nr:hypothetical protein [Massilia eurypsychrophila]PIL42955.1 hypothetical protein CR105_21580 [Massilia eurypsychrophila]